MRRLTQDQRVELVIVLSGARRDLGQPDAAVLVLQDPASRTTAARPWAARLWYAYADALLVAGRHEQAREWFERTAGVDVDGQTDAGDRVLALDGVVLDEPDDEPEEGRDLTGLPDAEELAEVAQQVLRRAEARDAAATSEPLEEGPPDEGGPDEGGTPVAPGDGDRPEAASADEPAPAPEAEPALQAVTAVSAGYGPAFSAPAVDEPVTSPPARSPGPVPTPTFTAPDDDEPDDDERDDDERADDERDDDSNDPELRLFD